MSGNQVAQCGHFALIIAVSRQSKNHVAHFSRLRKNQEIGEKEINRRHVGPVIDIKCQTNIEYQSYGVIKGFRQRRRSQTMKKSLQYMIFKPERH